MFTLTGFADEVSFEFGEQRLFTHVCPSGHSALDAHPQRPPRFGHAGGPQLVSPRPWHARPAAHWIPQPPQLSLRVARFRQVGPQQTWMSVLPHFVPSS